MGEHLKGVSNLEPPKAAGHTPRFIWSYRSSSFSWFLMHARTIASSNPTVDTKYPRAQNTSPVKLRLRPCDLRTAARW
jgi:hypothetical protein